MSSKARPGQFRCYEAALPDEPFFVILARDPAAPATLEFWARERMRLGKVVETDDRDRIKAAIDESKDFQQWRDDQIAFAEENDMEPVWRMPRQFEDEQRPVVSESYTDHNPDPTYLFTGCKHSYTLEELTQIVQTHERRKSPHEEFLADKIATGLRDVTNHLTIWIQDKSDSNERVKWLGGVIDRINGYALELEENDLPPPPVAEDTYKPLADALKPVDEIPLLTPGERVVIDTKPDDLAHAPEVAPHRFSFFHKGERYAYAKGLEINPTHLPVALDAMALDGWHLLAIFGQTDSANVGFIFERDMPQVYHTLAHIRQEESQVVGCGPDGRGRGIEL